MRAKQPNMPTGVTFRPRCVSRPYMAWVKVKKTFLYLGYYATISEAIMVADFTRYIAFGVEPTRWRYLDRRRTQKPPTAPPVVNLEEKISTNLSWILSKLNDCEYLDQATIRVRMLAYRENAAKLSGTASRQSV